MSANNKTQSIKCNQAPGGKSTFAFNYEDYGINETRIKNEYNILTNENMNIENIKDKNQSIKTGYGSKSNLNIFGESSIKVTVSPGGMSNVYLGNDSTNYEDYRKKN